MYSYPNFLADLGRIIDSGVVVNIYNGDADYIVNWFGSAALVEQVNHTTKAQFNAAGYVPFVVDGVEYGETKQYGNFSFTRIYEAGHEVPFYQPVAALALFNRSINHFNIADGTEMVTLTYSTNGTANATHTESFVPLPTTMMPSGSVQGGTGPSTTVGPSGTTGTVMPYVPWRG